MHFHFAAFSLLTLANTAFAHYRWTKLIANGAATGEYQHVRLNTNYNSPVTDVTSNDIRCNTGTQPNAAKTSTYSVAAGSTSAAGVPASCRYEPAAMRTPMSPASPTYTTTRRSAVSGPHSASSSAARHRDAEALIDRHRPW